MGKRIGLFMSRFLMVFMTFGVLFLEGVSSRTFAGDISIFESGLSDFTVLSLFDGMNSYAVAIIAVTVVLLSIIIAILLDSKRILEK